MNDQATLERLANLAREEIPEDPVDPAYDNAERDRLVAAIARGGARPPRARMRVAFSLAAAAAIAAAIALFWPAPRLDYTATGARVTEGGYVSTQADADARLDFSDGSSVALSAGASLRVADITAHGARVLLEDGRAALEITKRPGARWSVEAGPFTVLVTGTAFHVEWARGEEALRVDLQEGAVLVRGPMAPDGLPLRAGQHLVARLREGDVQITGGDDGAPGRMTAPYAPTPLAAPAATPEAPEAPRESEAAHESDPGRGAPATDSDAAPTSWSRRVAAGDFRGVLAEAEARGVDGVLQGAPLDDLVALSDAARYARRNDIARRALAATRKRFARTGPGRDAAFLLGRLADSASPGAAIAWYDTYLAESPSGPFAADALGRKMLATRRTAGPAAARLVAEQYLARYPRGPHATLAKELVAR